ncbi:MAG: hypothetical protein E6J47_02240 [Chloroflexi bacterium]|nr:MAG: hypothetical protein E6J47_02240 [Chloroflexota bacterium]
MSRGRPRHQASRRRSYSNRQRELRERQLRPGERRMLAEERVADGEAGIEIESISSWEARLHGRASAA